MGAGGVRRVGALFWVRMESLNWNIDSDWAIPYTPTDFFGIMSRGGGGQVVRGK